MPAISTMTLKYLRDNGYEYDTTERWVRFFKKFKGQMSIRKDMFGFGDYIAIREDCIGSLSIQACDATSHSKRVKKALENTRLPIWLKSQNRFCVMSWRRYGKRGEKKFWKPRITRVNLNGNGSMYTEDVYHDYAFSEARPKKKSPKKESS